MRVEESVQINRPPQEVFDYVANPENLPEWAGSSLEIQKDAPGPLGQGDRFMSVSKFLGKHIEMPFEITAYETGRLYSHRSTGGPFATEWTLSFEERAVGGTRLTQVAEGEPGGFFKLAEPLLERLIRRQFRTDLENLKDLLEARG